MTDSSCICVQSQKALQDFVVEQNREEELYRLPERIYIQDENAFFNDNRLGKKNKKLAFDFRCIWALTNWKLKQNFVIISRYQGVYDDEKSF